MNASSSLRHGAQVRQARRAAIRRRIERDKMWKKVCADYEVWRRSQEIMDAMTKAESNRGLGFMGLMRRLFASA